MPGPMPTCFVAGMGPGMSFDIVPCPGPMPGPWAPLLHALARVHFLIFPYMSHACGHGLNTMPEQHWLKHYPRPELKEFLLYLR